MKNYKKSDKLEEEIFVKIFSRIQIYNYSANIKNLNQTIFYVIFEFVKQFPQKQKLSITTRKQFIKSQAVK